MVFNLEELRERLPLRYVMSYNLTFIIMFSVSGSMLEIYVTSPQKQVANISFVLKDSDMDSENLSLLIWLSVSDGQLNRQF